MLARVGSGEGKFATARASLSDNAVVVVEGLFDRYEDTNVGFGDVGSGIVVPYFGVVVTWSCELLLLRGMPC